MIIELDMYQTLAIAVVVLMLGKFLRKKCSLLEKFCIPAPVVGGVLFAVFTCVCYVTGIVEFTFDDILKEVCMVFFFTSVGFQANLKVLKSGGKSMLVFLSLVTPPPPPEKITDEVTINWRTLTAFKDLGSPWYRNVGLWYALFVAGILGCYAAFSGLFMAPRG